MERPTEAPAARTITITPEDVQLLDRTITTLRAAGLMSDAIAALSELQARMAATLR
jgi:hypothetical protein